MNKKNLLTIVFTLMLGTSMVFAGDGKGTQAKCQSEQLIKVSSTMADVAGSLVQLSISLKEIQSQLSLNSTSADQESIKANLEIVRENITLMSQELNRFPLQADNETELENSEIFFYEE